MAWLRNLFNKRRFQRKKRKIVAAYLLTQDEQYQRDYWVHPINKERHLKGEYFTLYPELREYPEKFFRWFRMSIEQFDFLLQELTPSLQKQNNNYRASVSPEERLVVTLR